MLYMFTIILIIEVFLVVLQSDRIKRENEEIKKEVNKYYFIKQKGRFYAKKRLSVFVLPSHNRHHLRKNKRW